ncbi:helix-turn-helix domain-containing protein [Aquimarina algiphila]|uniref:Bacteriophage CI repressor n=1 Tax=Aquimarina algiphila TaxID=2047982 RepID=A0A554VL07_9FLAO|nr:helix-turn-helix domain-containing protein [Aquimarina algiphila]TSE08755.1 bacteriophage CI repressor [Aquimarina algiphila]
MTKIKSQNAILILDRLKELLEIDSDFSLSEYLGVKANTISSWKKRNSLDYSLIIAKCEHESFDLNYVFLNSSKDLKTIKNTNENSKLAKIAFEKAEKNEEVIEELKCQIEGFKTLLKIDEELKNK